MLSNEREKEKEKEGEREYSLLNYRKVVKIQ